jgi:hypothetical protein
MAWVPRNQGMLLSIAGGPSGRWAVFAANIIAGPAMQPLSGSFGINFDLDEDLGAAIFAANGNQLQAANDIQARHPDVHGNADLGAAPVLRPRTLKSCVQCIDFAAWATSNEVHFFLRKGRSTLGLYRRTSGYTYVVDAPGEYRHRVSYSFVRAPTQEETEDGEALGHIPDTISWVPRRF